MDADFDRELELASDAGIGYARGVLTFLGGLYILLGLLLGPLMSAPLFLDPDGSTGVAIGLLLFNTTLSLVFCGAFGIANLAAARGLARGRKWAWGLAIAIGAIYFASACLPFGAVVLYGTLNEKTRKIFS